MELHISDALLFWITQHGVVALFIMVSLGFMGLPMPQNLLVIFAGVLAAHAKLSIIFAFFAAYTGTLTGIILSYIIGKYAGVFLLEKYGRYVGMTKVRIKKADEWYEHVGKWSLLVGYYFPIIRRLLGYAAGLANLSWIEFLPLMFCGGLIWVIPLLSMGYFLGESSLSIF